MDRTLTRRTAVVDDLSAFAEELVPEAFTRRHTAFRVHRVVEPFAGETGFIGFVETLLHYTLSYRCSCGALPTRMVVVEGGDGIAWYWDQEDWCPVDWTVRRVRREAHPIPEPWLFAIELHRPQPGPTWWDGVTAPVSVVPPPPDLGWTAVLYAEARGRGMAATHAALVDLEWLPHEDADRILLHTPVPVGAEPTTRAFHRLLYGHPARKAHPLRRS